MRNFLKLITLLIILPFTLSASIPDKSTIENESKYILNRSILWGPGMDGSKFYRIPAVITADDGTLVAVADKRIDTNADLPGRIDVVCKTSSDNGKTWTPSTTVIAHDANGGYGDPALVADKKTGDILCIMTHGNGLWQSTPDNHAVVMVSRSSDNGKTWSRPVDITPGLFTTEYNSQIPVKGTTLFATSGRAVQLTDGRLMFVAVVRTDKEHGNGLKCYAVYSDDGGHKWNSSPIPADTEGDESKIVQTGEQQLLMSIRNPRRGHRKFSVSNDRGLTWSKPVVSTTLTEPACNGDIINYTAPDGRKLLLHSIPDDPEHRRNVSIYASDDKGATWNRLITVCPEASAYSSITIAKDGTLGCLTEEETAKNGYCLWYTSINIDQLVKDKFSESEK